MMPSLYLTLRLLIAGAAWAWTFGEYLKNSGNRWANYIVIGTTTLVTGFAINISLALLLGEFGLYQPSIELTVLAIISLIGIIIGTVKNARQLRRHFTTSVPLAIVFLVGTAFILQLTSRGDWLIGGWDPGVYISEGIGLETRGTLHRTDIIQPNSLKAARTFSRRCGGSETRGFHF